MNLNNETAIALEEYDLAMEAITSNDIEVKRLYDSNERLSSILVALENIESTLKEGKVVSLESIALVSNLSTEGSDLPSDYFFGQTLSLEVIAHKRRNILSQIFQNVAVIFSKAVENAQFFYTTFNVQTSRLNKQKRLLSMMNQNNVSTVSVGISKYMLYGHRKVEVTDMKDYVKQYKQMTDVMTRLNEGLSVLAEDDLFTTLTMIKEFFKGNSDKYFKDRFLSLLSTMDKIRASTHMKVENKRPVSTEYASDVLLGMSQVVMTEPNKNSYSLDDYRSLVDAHKYFYLYVERVSKYDLSTILSGSVKFDVTKEQCKEILGSTDSLLTSANKLNAYASKLSTYYASMQNGAYAITALRDDDSDDILLAFTRAGRILNRISAILYDSVASSYNFSLGNVKKGLSIVESYTAKNT